MHTAKVGNPPENGETIEANWKIQLQTKDFSSGLHWAIVDRSGVKAAYNYGFS